jgi:Uma2 family endonuclease
MLPDRRSKRGEPTWEMARFYPAQGAWTESEYLALEANQLIEFSDGLLEFLPMPTILHQQIVKHVHNHLDAFVEANATGSVLFAPLPVRLRAGKFREPDIIYLKPERIKDVLKQPEGADLVMEVVSGEYEDRERDLKVKRVDYAAAKIAEYWIVDPEEQQITVLTLDGDAYREHGVFRPGERAASVLLPGFGVDVAAVFAAGQASS